MRELVFCALIDECGTKHCSVQVTRMAERQLIIEVMAENGITPESVPAELDIVTFSNPGNNTGSKRYFNTKEFALFQPHGSCSRKWGSAHSWSVMDLKKQQFRHHFGQGCQKCDGTVQPEYDEQYGG